MRDSVALIARLRSIAADIGVRQPGAPPETGWPERGLGPRLLHDIYAETAEDGPAAAGFALASAMAAGALPVVWMRMDAGDRDGGRLHGGGLAALGLIPESLVVVAAADATALLRAAGEVARCPAVGTLVIESRGTMTGLDLTATRRLVLAAEASGVTILSLRIAAAPVPSAAASRWRVAALPSAALAAGAPGAPAFDVECLRRRGGPAGDRRRVEWNRETRCFCTEVRDRAEPAPLAGAGLSLAADRAIARDPAAPVRRTG